MSNHVSSLALDSLLIRSLGIPKSYFLFNGIKKDLTNDKQIFEGLLKLMILSTPGPYANDFLILIFLDWRLILSIKLKSRTQFNICHFLICFNINVLFFIIKH
ncbi:hypothetical protein BpHYR1_001802 [Brachionus plicatilis]|uniref:Uncharacterized protein n=1 Tax=Brachionus plicatilis TaxID=10195 RepID=A0A3M7T9A2_BRAPC|nr:hypothetical protein BpHYR1_001802 [Brachionus plicatilis]